MTTNAGSREIERGRIGFGDHGIDSTDGKKALEKVFSPEFRNRLDATIFFGALSREVTLRVVGKFLDEVDGQLAERHVELEVDEAARAWFAEHGYDQKFGARPMQRLIQDKLKVALADELLFGVLAAHGGRVLVTAPEGDIHIECIAREPEPDPEPANV